MKTQKTSLEAFKNMQPKIPNDHQVILSVLTKDKSLTYHEIAEKIRLQIWYKTKEISNKWNNPNKVSRRLKELVLVKKIEACEPRICTIAKSNCKTYRLLTTKTE